MEQEEYFFEDDKRDNKGSEDEKGGEKINIVGETRAFNITLGDMYIHSSINEVNLKGEKI